MDTTGVFIRVRRRRLKKNYKDDAGVCRDDWHALDFVLVASRRTPKGPRQKIVGYVGTIEERLKDRPWIRRAFYRDALPRLKELAGPEHLSAIAEKLHAIVAPATEEESAKAVAAEFAANKTPGEVHVRH